MMVRLTQLCILIFLFFAGNAVADTVRYALVVGNNQGEDVEDTLRYARRDARKIVNLLTQLGRFKAENTVLLLDKPANVFWQQLKQLEKRARTANKAGHDTMLLIYYSGHARHDALELGDTRVKFSTLRRFLEQSEIRVRLAFVDSCHSGRLISSKGARKGPAYKIEVNDEISSAGYAIITSSAQNELSQESKALRGAFFTHYLASALRGEADTSNDGKVTLQEAYEYAYEKTLSQTAGSIGVSQHPMYHFQLKGRGDIVLTHTRKSYSAVEVPYIESGKIMLLDGIGEEVLAEADPGPGEPVRFSVPPGPYIVYIVKKNGVIRIAETDVLARQTTVLSVDDFSTTTLAHAVAKGGLFKTPEYVWTHKLGMYALKSTAPLRGISAPWGGGLQYGLQHSSGILSSVRIFTSMAAHEDTDRKYHNIGIALGIGYGFDVDFLRLNMTMHVGYEHMIQDTLPEQSAVNGRRPHTSAFSGLGGAGIEVPFSFMYLFANAAAGGRVFQVVGRGWVPRFELQALAGAGVAWGSR